MNAALVRAVHDAYGPALHRYLMRRLANAEDARDLAQEVYVRLLRLEHAVLIRSPQAYVFRIAENLVCELRARELREVVMFDSRIFDHAAGQTSDPFDQGLVEQIDMQRSLESVLAGLAPLHAEIFIMKKWDGLSMEEIATGLGISIHTVKKYLHHSTSQCRSALANLYKFSY